MDMSGATQRRRDGDYMANYGTITNHGEAVPAGTRPSKVVEAEEIYRLVEVRRPAAVHHESDSLEGSVLPIGLQIAVYTAPEGVGTAWPPYITVHTYHGRPPAAERVVTFDELFA